MPGEPLREEALTRSVIGAFYEVYSTLGFGYMEQIYCEALSRELITRGHHLAREVLVRVMYKGEVIGRQRLDLIVDDILVVEVKSTAELHPVARRQLLSYLRATNLELGLLFHFGPRPKFYRFICST
ncbi:MAG TPA: GxxExxY protein [Gemmatimonadaceae bacterium]|nr:GxxExxY protein [Gemmatimonadaceae bacterium]